MMIFGSVVTRRSFLEEVKFTVEFLNFKTLEHKRRSIITKIALLAGGIGFFLLAAFSTFVVAFLLAFNTVLEVNENDVGSVKILALTYIGTWTVTMYVLLEFTFSMTRLRQVVKIVTKVDLFLRGVVMSKKKRLSYYRTTATVKYVVEFVMAFVLVPRLLAHYNMKLMNAVLYISATLSLCFLVDVCIRKFTIMVHFIERRLKLLEDLLKKTWIGRGKGWQRDVKTLIQAQDLLCDACAVLNSVWKRMLGALVATIFVSLVRSPVTLSITIKKNGFDLWSTYELSYYLIYWLWNLYDITHYTQQCESQVQDFNSTLYCFAMSSAQMRNVETEFIDTLLVQLGRKRKVVFTAHGLFPVNHTLVHSVLAGVFTTLIIILQTGN